MQPVYVQPVVAYGFGGAAAVPQQWQQPQQPQQPQQQWQQPQPQPQWPQQPQQMVGMGGVPVGAVMPMGGIPPMGGMGGMPMMPVPQPESWQTVASRGAWVQVDGGLSCVSAGNDGSVWGVNLSQVRPAAIAPGRLRLAGLAAGDTASRAHTQLSRASPTPRPAPLVFRRTSSGARPARAGCRSRASSCRCRARPSTAPSA